MDSLFTITFAIITASLAIFVLGFYLVIIGIGINGMKKKFQYFFKK